MRSRLAGLLLGAPLASPLSGQQANGLSARSILSAFGLVCALQVSGAAHAQATCTADFSAMGQGRQVVTLTLKPDGHFEASVNAVSTNASGRMVDEQVRPQLNLMADPAGAEYATYNSAERSLVHLQTVMALPLSKDLVQLPFSLSAVRRMKTFDLAGKSDKFGGHVLLEAYDDRGASLGKVVRRIFVAACV